MTQVLVSPNTWIKLAAALLLCGTSCRVLDPTIPQRARVEAQKEVAPPAPIHLDELDAAEPLIQDLLIRPRSAPARIGDDELRSLQMRSVQLANAIQMIAEVANVNIYFDAELDRMVYASFPSITLHDALHVLLDQNGLRLVEDPPGIYWVTTNDGSQAETARFRVQSINAASIVDDLTQLVSQQAHLVVNEEQNLIVLDGTARDVDLVASYLESADRLKRQVLLEVELVELMLDDTFELGLQHTISSTPVDGPNLLSLAQNLATGTGEFSLTFDNSKLPFVSTLTALQQFAGVNVLSSPRVLAVTKSPAKIEVVTEVPYVQATVSTNVGGGAAGSSTAEEVQFKEVGLTLTVTPTIQEGGVVEIVIEQKFSSVTEFFLDIPVVESRNLSTVMTVADAHTAVLGGLIQNSIMEDDTGVPLLMDIPILGRLFRSDRDSTTRRQLLIFVTPRIVNSAQGERLSERYRSEYRESLRISGLSAAEELK